MIRTVRSSQHEQGQVVVMFALLIPVFLALGGFVIGIGNWYVHGKHLQTKADAGTFAGGSSWAFPCDTFIDARIAAQARLYAESNNPQVGGVPNSSIHTVLNGPDWYDDDSNPSLPPLEFYSPPTFSSPPVVPVCNAMILDVKVTEDNSFPLFSLIPLFPDIKRKARIQIEEAESIKEDLLPIAVRAPEPVSAAAVFYNEATGIVLGAKYLVKGGGINPGGMPPGLQPWSTFNTQDIDTWARFTPAVATGVAIAISFRGACDDGSLPPGNVPPNPNIITSPGPSCFDEEYTTMSDICNQPQAPTQIVNCYYATGNWPSESVQSGLHFIRGYQDVDPGTGPPALETAYLQNSGNCLQNGSQTTGYFNAHPNNTCDVQLNLNVDVGGLEFDPPGPPPPVTLRASDIQVRYRLVRADGTSSCNYGNQCNLETTSGGSVKSFSTQGSALSPHLPLTANSRGNAVAIEIRLQNATNHTKAACQDSGFDANCRWYYTGAPPFFSDSTAPTDVQILAAPVQRAFRGNSLTSSSVKWLRLTTDGTPCPAAPLPEFEDFEAASQPTSGPSCFVLDMGLKGGVAADQDDEPILFNDGVGPSQMGSIDCDPNIPQGQILIDGVIQGCGPEYGAHPFDWSPLCPAANNIFIGYPGGNPGSPWDDGRWPPIRCIKTRPTGSMNQLERGLDNRLFGSNNAPCPNDTSTAWAPGRNYWDADDNNFKGASYTETSPPSPNNISQLFDDPRRVTIFLAPTEAFATSGQDTYPITGFIDVYIRGYGRITGGGGINVDDPCPGSDPPSDLDLSGGSPSGYAIWGSIINHVHIGGGATGGGNLCNPVISTQSCVAVLVE